MGEWEAMGETMPIEAAQMSQELMTLELIGRGYMFPYEALELPFAEAVALIEFSVADHVAKSPDIRAFLAALPKGPGTDCPDSPLDELVLYASVRRGEIDKSDPSVNVGFMNTVVAPVFRFQGEQMLRLAVHPEAPPFLSLAIEAADFINDLWGMWFRRVCVPYQELDKEGRRVYKERAQGVLAASDYTIFDYEDGEFKNRCTWAQVHPFTVSALRARLLDMSALATDEANREYFLRLAEAYACNRIEDLEERWAAVDRAWIRIAPDCQVFCVHGMENGYEHPFCISPELRLVARATGDDARTMIERYRVATPEYAERVGLPAEFVDIIRTKLSRIDIGVFVSVIESGCCLNFRYTGQVVPNRQEILAEGGKIFMAQSSVGVNVRLLHSKVDRHCTPETAAFLKPYITEATELEHTVFHELFHPVGCTPEVDVALGDVKNLLEEAKASIGGMVVCDLLDPSPQKRLETMATALARVLRFMANTELDNATFAPYVRENLVVATKMLDLGIIRMTAGGVHVDTTAVLDGRLFEDLGYFIRAVLGSYIGHDRETLKSMTNWLCSREHEEIAELIAWVNRAE